MTLSCTGLRVKGSPSEPVQVAAGGDRTAALVPQGPPARAGRRGLRRDRLPAPRTRRGRAAHAGFASLRGELGSREQAGNHAQLASRPPLSGSRTRTPELYAAMDWLLQRRIEQKLAARHLHNDGMALTSSSGSETREQAGNHAQLARHLAAHHSRGRGRGRRRAVCRDGLVAAAPGSH